jgi:hypothetical protein
MGELQTQINLDTINEAIGRLPDLYLVQTGKEVISSEDKMYLAKLRRGIPELKYNEIWKSLKLSYMHANKENQWTEAMSNDSEKEIYKLKVQSICEELGDIPIRAIKAVFTQSRKFTEIPTVTSLQKSWNTLKPEFHGSERKIINGYLAQPDDMHTKENTDHYKDDMFKVLEEMGVYTRKKK